MVNFTVVSSHAVAKAAATVLTVCTNILLGLSLEQATNFARTMGFSESCVPSAADTMMKLYQIFIEKDALLIEINPMAEDSLGRGTVCLGKGNSNIVCMF